MDTDVTYDQLLNRYEDLHHDAMAVLGDSDADLAIAAVYAQLATAAATAAVAAQPIPED